MDPKPSEHPIQAFFEEAVHRSLAHKLGMPGYEDVEAYLAAMLVRFAHRERLFALRDSEGHRLERIEDMLPEGDIRQNAMTFEREREVHRHIGDYLLFWSGMFPEHLPNATGAPTIPDAVRQGSESYEIVSSFDYVPFDAEAPLYRKLSFEFEMFRVGLLLVRESLAGLRPPGPA